MAAKMMTVPPMKSHAGDEWYFRYQPVDFTKIEGPLGSSDEFTYGGNSSSSN